MEFKNGNRIRVKEGNYVGKEGVVDAIAENAPKCVGVFLEGAEEVKLTYWFKPTEIEKI